VKRAIRGGDLLARYGGDEFTIVSPQTGGVEAVRLAERVRRAVEGLRIGARGQTVRMTLSIGVASLTEVARSAAEPIVALLALADARLYCAKASGRNRVCTAVPQP
jgi:diguanylate cyclase (GGDEF)-like protein